MLVDLHVFCSGIRFRALMLLYFGAGVVQNWWSFKIERSKLNENCSLVLNSQELRNKRVITLKLKHFSAGSQLTSARIQC